MRAARLHAYHEALKLEEVDEPKAVGPFDVIV
jgi:NAD+-dependent secondary alcohol dehydrogenase Adh1